MLIPGGGGGGRERSQEALRRESMPPTRRAGRGAQGRLQCPPAPCPTLRRGQGPEDARTMADPGRGAASWPNSWVPWSCSHRDQGWFLVPFGDLPGGGASLENTPPQTAQSPGPQTPELQPQMGPNTLGNPAVPPHFGPNSPAPSTHILRSPGLNLVEETGLRGGSYLCSSPNPQPHCPGPPILCLFSWAPSEAPLMCSGETYHLLSGILPRIHPKSLPPPPHPHHSHSSQELTPVSTPPLLSSVHTIPPGHSAQLCR